ncbi:hypothetical protein CALCODRAFT_134397 [Calocera cornea HHB12733]|uniref:Uncharacterized protein n=1 Tax=Calocera cornea HHB12733 TaxID=1353952 RepID=A0A165CVT7_9BASI|nr:hypothetical protein CALCODRAFT_134397 [Calocera cornea HHB12733]
MQCNAMRSDAMRSDPIQTDRMRPGSKQRACSCTRVARTTWVRVCEAELGLAGGRMGRACVRECWIGRRVREEWEVDAGRLELEQVRRCRTPRRLLQMIPCATPLARTRCCVRQRCNDGVLLRLPRAPLRPPDHVHKQPVHLVPPLGLGRPLPTKHANPWPMPLSHLTTGALPPSSSLRANARHSASSQSYSTLSSIVRRPAGNCAASQNRHERRGSRASSHACAPRYACRISSRSPGGIGPPGPPGGRGFLLNGTEQSVGGYRTATPRTVPSKPPTRARASAPPALNPPSVIRDPGGIERALGVAQHVRQRGPRIVVRRREVPAGRGAPCGSRSPARSPLSAGGRASSVHAKWFDPSAGNRKPDPCKVMCTGFWFFCCFCPPFARLGRPVGRGRALPPLASSSAITSLALLPAHSRPSASPASYHSARSIVPSSSEVGKCTSR